MTRENHKEGGYKTPAAPGKSRMDPSRTCKGKKQQGAKL